MTWLFLLLPAAALAGDKINLAPDYKVRATPPPQTGLDLRYVVVEREGVRYKKFSGKAGDLYVLDGQALTKASIESGQCHGKPGSKGEPSSVTIVGAEKKLSDSDVKAFAGLIQDTTYDKCNNYQTARAHVPNLNVGLSKTMTDKNGQQKEYRMYNTGFGKNLNFSGQF
jgi:hypothetical protein